jgi:hypothetical protein
MELRTGTTRLSSCHGFDVSAGPLGIGSIETPLFAGPGMEPDHLLVRTDEGIAGTFRVVPAALVLDVDRARRLVVLDADSDTVAALPRQLPLTGAGADRRDSE